MGSGKVKRTWRVICLLVTAALALSICGGGASAAAEIAWTQTSRADFVSCTLSQLDVSSSPGSVKIQATGASCLYAFRGNNQKTFWKYNIASNAWTPLADAPDKVKWGGALAYDGGSYIYAFRGSGSGDFWKYSIPDNKWSALSAAPGALKEGGALTYNNGFIYALRGNDTSDFWRYNPAANVWTPLASAGGDIGAGGSLTDDGGSYLYAFYGLDTKAFRRYDISADAWTPLADAPAALNAGGSLSYDGSRYIYALCGGLTPYFWQYDTLSGIWSVKAHAPAAVDWGGALVYIPSGYVLALTGASSQHFWKYDVSADAWEWRAGTPAVVWDGGALVKGEVIYQNSGSLVSAAYNTGTNADFGAISWTAAVPSGTSLKFQVAANTDNATWIFKGPDGAVNTYYASGAAIWSGLDGSRYLKYKAVFSTNITGVTPVLNDVTITYSRQISPPAAVAAGTASVGETAAVLSGAVSDDGGEPCRYRFQYGQISGNYTQETPWTGAVINGETYSVEISGLKRGAQYYFRAQIKNSAGTANTTGLSFWTRPAPPVAGSFTARAVNTTQIQLGWVKGEGAQRTMVRRKTGDYPADINDGVLVYFDTGSAFTDSKLNPETAYYYRAWSEVGGSEQWSGGSQTATAKTTLPVAVGGVVFKVNKALVAAPWLGVAALFLAASCLAARRFFKPKK